MKDSTTCVLTLCDHRSIFCPPDTLQYSNIKSKADSKADSTGRQSSANSNASSPTRSASSKSSSEDEDNSDSQHEFKPASLYDKDFPIPPIPPNVAQFAQLCKFCFICFSDLFARKLHLFLSKQPKLVKTPSLKRTTIIAHR